MKLRHTIKQLNQSRRMYLSLFREAALNTHPTNRKKRNQLVTEAFIATAGTPKSYRRIILNPKPGSTRKLKAPKQTELHATKDTEFDVDEEGVITLTNLLNNQGQLWIGMLIISPERPPNWKPKNPRSYWGTTKSTG